MATTPTRRGRTRLFAALFLMTALAALLVPSPAPAHNLDASAVYVFYDPDTQKMLDDRIAGGWTPGVPLINVGDEIGLIIKVVPDNGTTTGVGGYTTFYLPNGVQVTDAAFLLPGDLIADGISGYDRIGAKGQAQMPAVGAGGGPTVSLVGIERGENVLGIKSKIVTDLNVNLGTLPGVYGDTGIFYSTAPETAYGTYTGGTIKNNSGDTVGWRTPLGTPMNLWDAWQMAAYGIAGTTNPLYPATPIIDSNGRGNAPWGFANVVAGPQSGYAWEFDKAVYDACDATPITTPDRNCIDLATRNIGPWQRIQYPGSQFSDDPPGANPLIQPYTRGADASDVGFALSPSNSLPETTGQANGTPNAIRWSFGQLTYNTPEFAWVKFKVTAPITDCPVWWVDTFGGDAGGESGGKDHIWRYYDPNSAVMNGCLAAGKPATRDIVKVGDYYQYQLKIYNAGGSDLSNVVATDTLPAGATFISAFPSQTSGPNPLRWVIGELKMGESWEATVTVKAASSGILNNSLTATGTADDLLNNPPVTVTTTEKTLSGALPLLRQTKSATPTAVAPGDTVTYEILIQNTGTGPSGTPVKITEYLPDGFTYKALSSVTVNGASLTGATSVVATNPAQPVFSVPVAIQAGQSLSLKFTALVAADQSPGEYCNSYTSSTPVNQTTGSLACVQVAGGQIGDKIWRDWDGDGVQNAEEEGIAGVSVTLEKWNGTSWESVTSTTTDAAGKYLFTGLTEGQYRVTVTPPAGTTQTGDPDQPGTPCSSCDNSHTLTLATDAQYLTADFGYKPTGSGSIGDTVFEDVGNDGVYTTGTDSGISGVAVYLYEDTNGDGVITPDVDTLVAFETTDGSGNYRFENLAGGFDYIVYVDPADAALSAHFGTDPYQTSTPNPHAVDSLSGTYSAADIGFWKVEPASIGDQVYIDADGDGTFGAGDTPLAGVTVTLYRDGVAVATTVSGPDGTYLFDNLGPGTYSVVLDSASTGVPAGYSPSATTYNKALIAGEDYPDADFPFVPLIAKTVDKTAATPGQTLNYAINVNYPGDDLLTDVTVRDFIPEGTTFSSAGQGGVLETFTSKTGTAGQSTFGTTISRVYAFRGGSTATFWGYDPAGNTWDTTLPSAPGSITTGGALTSDGSRYVYAFQGGSRAFYRYDAVTRTWSDTAVADLPAGAPVVGAGGALVYRNGYVNAFVGGGSNQFWRYDVAANTWTQLTNAPNTIGAGGSLATDGTDVYGLRGGNTQTLYRYNTGDGTWTTLAASGREFNAGAGLVYGDDGTFYATTGGGDNRFYRYNPDANTWSEATNRDFTPNAGGALATDGVVFYALQGNNTTNFVNRSFTAATTTLAVTPATVSAGGALTYLSSPGAVATSSMTATPSVVALGSSFTVTLTLESTQALSGVTPSALTVTGGSATVSGPTPASMDLSAETPATFTWTVTPSQVGEFTFSALAGNGTVTFASATSNGVLVSPEGQSQYLAWNLGHNEPGTTGTTATSNYLYAFQGNDQLAFWAYNISSGTWNNPLNPTDTPSGVTVKEGGALTNDGVRYIYALRGDATRVFLRYDTTANAWDDTTIADLPATTDKTVLKGGSLVYLNGYVYAFLGNGSKQLWRYNVLDNTWSRMADTPVGVGTGGGLTTDGTNLYATQGNTKTGFWRYNTATNNWTVLAVTPAGVGDGGGLVYANGAVYVLRGGGQKTFWRYNIANNTWTTLAVTLGNIDDGGAISFNGTYINVLQGKTSTFYRYNFATNAWTTLTATPANVVWGGALTYLATGNVSRTTASAAPTLVGGVSQVTVRMTVTSANVLSNITANTLPTYTATGGVTATFSAATLVSLDDDISGTDDPVIYEWTATVTPGTSPGEITFTTSNSLNASAMTNSVIVTPTLTFTATVKDPAPMVISNTSLLNEKNATIENVYSNTSETYTTATIGDRVWADLDGDGAQDTGEYGLSGVKVYIDTNGNGVWDAGEPYDVTDTSGNYHLINLTAGTYTLRIDPATYPAGYIPTTPGSLTANLPTGLTQLTDVDFGLQPPPPVDQQGSIGDAIWLDADGDGVMDANESPIAGITVELYRDLDGDGVLDPGEPQVATDTTDVNGNYAFDGLPFGAYVVAVDQTSEVTSPYGGGTSTVGAAMAATYDLDDGTATDAIGDIPDHMSAVNVSSTIRVDTVDFGYRWSGSIGNYVWLDANNSGTPDAGETPIEGAVVLLYFDANDNGILEPAEYETVAFTRTAADGSYSFTGLPPGNYLVDVYEDSMSIDGVRELVPTTANVVSVDLDPGEAYVTADFGYFAGAIVQGTLFADLNRNAVPDAGEAGISGVTVTLTGTDMDGNPVSVTTITDANGHYSFVVPEGNYTVTYDTSSTNLSSFPEATTGTSYTFHAYPGEDWHPSFDFGVGYSGAIGDTVWNDANGDGTRNTGEVGLARVTVNLYAADGVTWLEAVVTDENGAYLFEGLPDGDYVVKVDETTVPAGFVQTFDNDGAQVDHTGTATISGGGTVDTVDFGYKYNSAAYSVSGTLWNDSDNQGDFDETTYLADVTVCLYSSTGSVVACTETTGTGAYTFLGIPEGGYTIRVNAETLPGAAFLPTYDPNGTGTAHETGITVSGGNVTDQNFGYYESLGSVTGTVHTGGDGDGIFEGGDEDPVAGVTLFLTGAGPDGILGTPDDVVRVAVTDASGNYAFDNLPPGPYQITKMNPAGFTSLADADGGNPGSISVMLGVGETKAAEDFELQAEPGVVGDRIWLDVDGDGAQDVGEPGLANVTVSLYDSGHNRIGTTTTDANGNYLFTDVPAGEYYVDVVSGVPAGLIPSPGTTDPGAVFTLADGQSDLTVDFGFTGAAEKAVIGDFVWADMDADGIQDPGEIGIAGVAVTLNGAGPDGIFGTADDIVVATTTTGPDGRYLFTNVEPGTYTVSVTPPAGYTVTSGPESQGAGTSLPVIVKAGDVKVNVDFGYDSPALHTITDRLWYDADRDGVFDAGEAGIGRVSVNLLDPAGNVIATVLTNADGTFTFSGVPDGAYTIAIADNTNQLSGYQYTTPAADAGRLSVTVAGADLSGNHFGYAGLGPVGDTIWSDANGDGIQDPGEIGIEGVTVELYFDVNGDGNLNETTPVATAVTDAAGQYLFNDLPAGTFFVKVTPPAGYTQTGDPDQSGVPCTTCDHMTAITLSPEAPSTLTADFGYKSGTNLADLSGAIWNDLNRNALDDGAGEPPIGGVTVVLLDDLGNVVATTTTAALGTYTFLDVPAGTYTVAVTDENGVLSGYELTSGLDAVPVTVGATDITGIDFGYVGQAGTGSIGDYVWLDANHDGVQGVGEKGVGNVTVNLYLDDGDGVFNAATDTLKAVTVTGTDGKYRFDGLLAGVYWVDGVETTLPSGGSGLAATYDEDGATATPDGVTRVVLSEGVEHLTADFGYGGDDTTGVLGDTVWYDADGDGIQDPGEVGIAGVTLTVTGPGGYSTTVTTGPDGTWLLTGLVPGDYTVTLTVPTGYNPPTNTAGNLSVTATVQAGMDQLTADFGLNAPDIYTATIGDTIYNDANGNGTQDAGETGIAGVTVNLLLDSTGKIVATVTTDAAGKYTFVGVPDGTWTVAVTDIMDVLSGSPQTGDPDATKDGRTTVVISGGTVTSIGGTACTGCDLSLDFGYTASGGSIGSLVWSDLNGNGIQDPGEPGVPGVEMELWIDTNENGTIEPGVDNFLRTTTTDSLGTYAFLGLPTGLDYIVKPSDSNFATGGLLQPPGYTAAIKDQGTDDTLDSDGDATLHTAVVTDLAGRNDTVDFGFVPASGTLSIGDRVWNDTDGDGVQETGETGIAGVTIALYDAKGVLRGTATTDTNGNYSFTGLAGGGYTVTVTDTGGMLAGMTSSTVGDSKPVTLTDASIDTVDFGYYNPIPTLAVMGPVRAFVDGAGRVVLEWETVSEVGTVGFFVSRLDEGSQTFVPVHEGLLPGLLHAPQGGTYRLADPGAAPGKPVTYRIVEVGVTGENRVHGPFTVTPGTL